MATALELMGLGLPAQEAAAIGQAANDSLTPTADNPTVVSPVTTLATASALGVTLKNASGQPIHIIRNNSGNDQTVNAASGETINGSATFTLTSAKVALFVPAQNTWLGGMFA